MREPLQPPAGPVDPDWHETFFDGLMNAFWLAAVPPSQTEAEAAFLLSALALQPAARVLDLGCGAGRMCLALAARGFGATGVDLSEDFLARARRATPDGADIAWLRQPLSSLDLPAAAFDGAFMLGNSFAYMAPSDTQAMLEATGRALKPGGRLVIHTGAAAECLLPEFEPYGDFTAGDVRLRLAHRYDPRLGAVLTRYEARRGRRVETRDGVQYVHPIREIAGMLRAAGLETTALCADADGTAWSLGDAQVYVVAERVE